MWWALAGAVVAIAIGIFILKQYQSLAIRTGAAEAEKEAGDEVLEANSRKAAMRGRQRVRGRRLLDRMRARQRRGAGS